MATPRARMMNIPVPDGCDRMEAPLWTSLAFACLGAAVWQWVELADRLSHLVWFALKFGLEPNLITAGKFMATVFFAASGSCIGLGLIATSQLRRTNSRFWLVSWLSVLMLVVGSIVWGGLLSSPLIRIVSR